ncbi:MAG: hypothetical protein ASUL_00930 [Candidatus Aramenus sulfurataquae]|jgi:proteasome lid subunit RPN8/RPN11|uniref:JAB domain-containing protein n=2 Tax=Candidatus Aramenus sulfurataquae TaxID=1326980 RepID=W7L8T2_9CREN|nr:MAG: hypothetical protein ASUL_00930 [Candidatus Aramenus sulfurataquae]MCL7342983.1 hypothetical protein [Candidatus Aramenus sulfurataquae]
MKERCGVIIGDSFYEVKNVSDREDEFEMDPQQLYSLLSKGELRAIVHTHSFSCMPSDKDLQGMRAWKVPWIIVSRECVKTFQASDLGVFEVDVNSLLFKKLHDLAVKLLK